jgi:hypothetical protein
LKEPSPTAEDFDRIGGQINIDDIRNRDQLIGALEDLGITPKALPAFERGLVTEVVSTRLDDIEDRFLVSGDLVEASLAADQLVSEFPEFPDLTERIQRIIEAGAAMRPEVPIREIEELPTEHEAIPPTEEPTPAEEPVVEVAPSPEEEVREAKPGIRERLGRFFRRIFG